MNTFVDSIKQIINNMSNPSIQSGGDSFIDRLEFKILRTIEHDKQEYLTTHPRYTALYNYLFAQAEIKMRDNNHKPIVIYREHIRRILRTNNKLDEFIIKEPHFKDKTTNYIFFGISIFNQTYIIKRFGLMFKIICSISNDVPDDDHETHQLETIHDTVLDFDTPDGEFIASEITYSHMKHMTSDVLFTFFIRYIYKQFYNCCFNTEHHFNTSDVTNFFVNQGNNIKESRRLVRIFKEDEEYDIFQDVNQKILKNKCLSYMENIHPYHGGITDRYDVESTFRSDLVALRATKTLKNTLFGGY
jgi:hypothetical protein